MDVSNQRRARRYGASYNTTTLMVFVCCKHPNQTSHPICLKDMRSGSISPLFDVFSVQPCPPNSPPPNSSPRCPILLEADAPSFSFAPPSSLISSSHCPFLLPLPTARLTGPRTVVSRRAACPHDGRLPPPHQRLVAHRFLRLLHHRTQAPRCRRLLFSQRAVPGGGGANGL